MNTIHYPSASVLGTVTTTVDAATYRYQRLDVSEIGNKTDSIDLYHIATLIGGAVTSVRLFVGGPVTDPASAAILTLRVSGDGSNWVNTSTTCAVNAYTTTALPVDGVRFVDAVVTTIQDGTAVDVSMGMHAAR